MVALFRAEAQASQQQAWLGSVQLHRPATLRWLSLLALGGVVAVGAFLFGLTILWEVLTTGKQVPGYPSLVIGLMTIGGVQLIMIGIVGEYIGKILSELKARPIYFVAGHSEKRADGETTADATERTAAE